MSEHELEKDSPLNGAPPPPPQRFGLTDPATGKFRPIREMTDQELERHIQGVGQAIGGAQQDLMKAHQEVGRITGLLSSFMVVSNMCAYELQRRQTSIITL